jgi:hypothetical protein
MVLLEVVSLCVQEIGIARAAATISMPETHSVESVELRTLPLVAILLWVGIGTVPLAQAWA